MILSVNNGNMLYYFQEKKNADNERRRLVSHWHLVPVKCSIFLQSFHQLPGFDTMPILRLLNFKILISTGTCNFVLFLGFGCFSVSVTSQLWGDLTRESYWKFNQQYVRYIFVERCKCVW